MQHFWHLLDATLFAHLGQSPSQKIVVEVELSQSRHVPKCGNGTCQVIRRLQINNISAHTYSTAVSGACPTCPRKFTVGGLRCLYLMVVGVIERQRSGPIHTHEFCGRGMSTSMYIACSCCH